LTIFDEEEKLEKKTRQQDQQQRHRVTGKQRSVVGSVYLRIYQQITAL
jgi:hypothetical protein